jgi:hypothetical protein
MNLFGTLCFIFFVANTYTIAKAEDDGIAEELIDFGTGFAIASCEADEECMKIAVIMSVPIILIYICLLCSGFIDPEYVEPIPAKRLIRTGLGYAVGRQIFN